MNPLIRRSFLTAAGLLLVAVAGPVTAQTNANAPAPVRAGQLGENYFNTSWAWYSFKDLPIDGQGISLEFNWSIIPHLDFTSTFDWMETDPFLGVKAEMQTLLAGVRTFAPQGRVNFYAEALVGVAAAKADYVHEDAFAYRLGGGAEIQVVGAFTITPFIYYLEYATSYGSGGSFYYGAKANVWVGRSVGFTAMYSQNDDHDSTATLGMSIRF